MGRHLVRLQALDAESGVQISRMSWLFPSEHTLEGPSYVGRDSPITIVGEGINTLLAAAVPHHYSLIEIGNAYPFTRASARPWDFRVNEFYMDPLSDQIPPERGHEVWNRRSPFRDGDYQRHRETVRTVVKTKLSAILSVDLQHAFQASPRTAKSSSSMPSSSPRRLSGKRSAHGDATA